MCHGSFLLWAFPDCNAALPNLLKNCEIQVEFSRVKKSEDLTEGFNLFAGKGNGSRKSHLHYQRSLACHGRHRVCFSPHSVLLMAQRADVIKLHN